MSSLHTSIGTSGRDYRRTAMKIVLLSPKGPLYRYRGGIFRKNLRYAPLTLTTLASLVPSELNASIEIYDEGVQEIPLDIEADLIGMTVITGTAPRAYELARQFRRQGIRVVLGGPHVTLLPDEAQQHADSIVVGYAEQTWPQLLRDAARGELQPRYLQGTDLRLDGLPFPRRDLLRSRDYLTMDVFEATRSCNHACDFCVAPVAWGRKPYQKPVEYVVEDIRRQRCRRAIFVDLNLISDCDYASRLFKALIPLRVKWFGLVTTIIAHEPELLELMARSGCNGLLLGFESISKSNLRKSKKGFNSPDQYCQLIDRLHRYKISIMGCFVFGLDHDSSDVFAETARFVIDAGIDLPRFAIVTPFPSTPLYHRLEQEGRILTRNWELYDGQHVVFQPREMSVRELESGHEWAWRQVYGWGPIARRVVRSVSQIPVSIIANLGYRFYAHHLHDFYNCDWVVGSTQRLGTRAP